VEAGVAEAAGESLGIGDAELDFDFGGHGFRVQGAVVSVQLSAFSRATRV
jgi:hypothetical protein